MPAPNRFKGVLQPRQLGLPKGELPLLLLYDIEDNRIRARVAGVCLDYGLERIQFSAFFGRLDRNKREELAVRLMKEIEEENVRVRIIPLTEECLEAMWEYNWWRLDADELARQTVPDRAPDLPRIRVIPVRQEDL